uniref:WASH complex subunit strumpellin n=1 Tax=Trichuris muris TaxID=70415 RepID=A0A5S6QBQ5_TRIMR
MYCQPLAIVTGFPKEADFLLASFNSKSLFIFGISPRRIDLFSSLGLRQLPSLWNMTDPLEQFVLGRLCGSELLKLIAHGHVLLAEISSVSDVMPKVFLGSFPPTSPYSKVLKDFTYFQDEDKVDNEIKEDKELQELDLKIWDDHEQFIRRAVNCMNSIGQYRSDLVKLFADLDGGVYGSECLESLASNPVGKQLLAESVYVMGVILLTLDRRIGGPIRERLLVFCYRHADWRSSFGNSFANMCTIFRSSNYAPSKRCPGYPENLFARAEVSKEVVNFLIFGFRDEPSGVRSFPSLLPSSADSGCSVDQGAIVFVLLYFVPNVLHSCPDVMEEVVKKYFTGDFVIHLYMGSTVNLLYEWNHYKAAWRALKSQCSTLASRTMSTRLYDEFERFKEKPFVAQPEGLDKQHVVSNVHTIIQSILRMNRALRWCILNCCTAFPEWNSIKQWRNWRFGIDRRLTLEYLFQALLRAAQYEQRVKEIVRTLLDNKVEEMKLAQREVFEKLDNVLSFCNDGSSGEKETDSLTKLLQDAREAVGSASPERPQTCSRTLSLTLRQLKTMKRTDTIRTRTECLMTDAVEDLQNSINKFMELQGLKEDSFLALQDACDFAYGWELISRFLDQLRLLIRVQPSSSVVLHPLFFKMSSAFSAPLHRIGTAGDPSFSYVSEYYSEQLITFLKEVVSVIPASICVLFSEVLRIRNIRAHGLPYHTGKADLIHHSRLEQRVEISKLINAISSLADGMVPLGTAVFGVIKVNPKQMLEDGILEELTCGIFELLNSSFVFKHRGRPGQFAVSLWELELQIRSHRETFQYISDYLDIRGLYVWHQAFDDVLKRSFVHCLNSELQVDFSFEMKPLLRTGVKLEFISQLAKRLIEETFPKCTVFLSETNSWVDVNTQEELVNRHVFSALSKCFDSVGVYILDQYFCFMISQKIAHFFAAYQQATKEDVAAFDTLKSHSACAADCLDGRAESACSAIANLTSKMSKAALQLQEKITSIGHFQLIRLCFNQELAKISQRCANYFQETVETLNSAHIRQLLAKAREGELSNEDRDTLLRLGSIMDRMGLTDPLKKVYGSFVQPDDLGKFLFYCVLAVLPRFSVYQFGLLKKQSDNMDGIPYLVGIMTLLMQFTDHCGKSFWDEAKACIEISCLVQAKDQPFGVSKFLNFMSHAPKLSHFPVAEKFWESVPQTLLI